MKCSTMFTSIVAWNLCPIRQLLHLYGTTRLEVADKSHVGYKVNTRKELL